MLVGKHGIEFLSATVISLLNIQCLLSSDRCLFFVLFSALTPLGLILVEKDSWSKEFGITLRHLIRQQKEAFCQEAPVNLPKILLLSTSIDATERNKLKAEGVVDNFLVRPLRLSVMIDCLEMLGLKSVHVKKEIPTPDLLKGKRILVVDDNVTNRRVAEGNLKRYKAIVTCVNSGMEAVKSLTPPHNFEACFMDLQMPEIDGFLIYRSILFTFRSMFSLNSCQQVNI